MDAWKFPGRFAVNRGDLVRLKDRKPIDDVARRVHCEIYGKCTSHYHVPAVQVGDLGTVRSEPDPSGLFEVAFQQCTIICTEKMVRLICQYPTLPNGL
jgi:hypothetical protein